MAGKVAQSTEYSSVDVLNFSCETVQRSLATDVRPIKVTLSGTVLVEFDVTLMSEDGTSSHIVVRVEFPDEVRSMLESSTWVRGMNIHEVVSRLGGNFLLHYGAWVTRLAVRDRGPQTGPPTFHLPLSYVRSNLAAVCASVA